MIRRDGTALKAVGSRGLRTGPARQPYPDRGSGDGSYKDHPDQRKEFATLDGTDHGGAGHGYAEKHGGAGHGYAEKHGGADQSAKQRSDHFHGTPPAKGQEVQDISCGLKLHTARHLGRADGRRHHVELAARYLG